MGQIRGSRKMRHFGRNESGEVARSMHMGPACTPGRPVPPTFGSSRPAAGEPDRYPGPAPR